MNMRKQKNISYTTKEQKPTIVKEVGMAYYSDKSFSTIINADSSLLINTSRNGISMHKISQIMDRYQLTLKDTANILNVSERTLQRYSDDDILSKDITERALRLQRLYERGTEVFGTLDNFTSWMKSSILIFNNEKPISFLDTIFGFELLEQEIGRIEHGIFA